MANPIDKLMAIDTLKADVDAAHKEAKAQAEDFLAELRDTVGTTALTSTVFGPEAGEYKYGKTRAKKAVEYNLADQDDFEGWINDNAHGVYGYLARNVADFAEWWLTETGEVPDGISRVEYEVPATVTAPKLYKLDREAVRAKLTAGGNYFEEANKLLLGDGE